MGDGAAELVRVLSALTANADVGSDFIGVETI